MREALVEFFNPPKASSYHSDVDVEKELKKVKDGLVPKLTDPFSQTQGKIGSKQGEIVCFSKIQNMYLERFEVVIQKLQVGTHLGDEEDEEEEEMKEDQNNEEDEIDLF